MHSLGLYFYRTDIPAQTRRPPFDRGRLVPNRIPVLCSPSLFCFAKFHPSLTTTTWRPFSKPFCKIMKTYDCRLHSIGSKDYHIIIVSVSLLFPVPLLYFFLNKINQWSQPFPCTPRYVYLPLQVTLSFSPLHTLGFSLLLFDPQS